MADKDTRSRKWQLTINNPVEKQLGHEKIKELVSSMASIIYWCMADEVGENGTPHTHVYLHNKNAVRFSTVKNLFPESHIEMAKGTAQQNMEYITKTGKWEKDKKRETSVDGTFEEFGEMPIERQGKRNDLDDLYCMIKDGLTDFQILEIDPTYMLHMEKIEKARQTILADKYSDEWINREVTYIWGDTGSGKTRYVMEKYGYRNVYRVTDYGHPFDGYRGQEVIMFEEFRSGLTLGDMLKYTDGYPVELPCRYANKIACHTKVYIVTNIPLTQQYPMVQREDFEGFRSFLRRINRVMHYTGSVVETSKIELRANGFIVIPDDDTIPFKGDES